jgi:hypothetical protein
MTQVEIEKIKSLSGLETDVITKLANVVVQEMRVNSFGLQPVSKRNQTTGQLELQYYRVVRQSKYQRAGDYALNFVETYQHERNYAYVGENLETGKLEWVNPEVSFAMTTNGTTKIHTTPEGRMYVYFSPQLSKWVFEMQSRPDSYTFLVREANPNFDPTRPVSASNSRQITVRREFAVEELAAMAKVSVETIYQWDTDYYYGVERDPETHITSIFLEIFNSGDSLNVYAGQVYINGKPFSGTGYGNYVTAVGKTGSDYVARWKMYNDCTKETAVNGGSEAGNYGLCELVGPMQSGDEQNPRVFVPQYDREFAILELQIEELPAQGKNLIYHAYFDMKTRTLLFEPAMRTPDNVVFL